MPRLCAARALSSVLQRRAPLDTVLSADQHYAKLDPRDRAFVRLLVSTALRRKGQIGAVLSPFLETAPPPLVRCILDIACVQLLFLGTPAYAAVNGAVGDLKRGAHTARYAKLANAVLRRVDENGKDALATTTPIDNLPGWLREGWIKQYGKEGAAQIAAQIMEPPPLDICLSKRAAAAIEDWAERLDAETLPGGATLRRKQIGDVTSLPGFASGEWWIQGAAASLPVRLLGDIAGKRVLDMCAAPGGKTMQLADAGADVTAIDISQSRAQRIEENLARTGLSATIKIADAASYTDRDGFDHIIVDAPCSATGTIRKHPEILHIRGAGSIKYNKATQKKLLARAAQLLRPGGTMIYCTCSLEKGEGEARVAPFLKAFPEMRIVRHDVSEILSLTEAIGPKGGIRVLPHHLKECGGLDGFFIAHFARCESQ